MEVRPVRMTYSRSVRDGVGLAAGEELGDDGAQGWQVAAAGAEEVQVPPVPAGF
ncbi:hypothetical protein [Streptomyces sp. NPDC060031]|uniref:hypothetical protein n=1 Tax=Streptomyces sp. NPDC060031 TaxID=3347043 RepID=UPI00368AC630